MTHDDKRPQLAALNEEDEEADVKGSSSESNSVTHQQRSLSDIEDVVPEERKQTVNFVDEPTFSNLEAQTPTLILSPSISDEKET